MSVPPDDVTRAMYELGTSASYVCLITGQKKLARMPRDGGAVETVLAADFFFDLVVDDTGAYVSIANEGVYFVPDAL